MCESMSEESSSAMCGQVGEVVVSEAEGDSRSRPERTWSWAESWRSSDVGAASQVSGRARGKRLDLRRKEVRLVGLEKRDVRVVALLKGGELCVVARERAVVRTSESAAACVGVSYGFLMMSSVNQDSSRKAG